MIFRYGVVALLAVIGLAPLAAGTVHRPTMVVSMGLTAAGLSLLVVGLTLQGRPLRIGFGILFPFALLAVPLLQSLPLPFAIRSAIDPNGTALLLDSKFMSASTWPLSLDPVSTRVDIGRAAAGVVAFLIAFHLAAGQTMRYAVPRLIGAAGIAALAIGLGHRMFGVTKLYGVLTPSWRSLLTGPFVNSNHTAEFLELAAFCCLACSSQRPTALNRLGWTTAAVFCAGGATLTLSRGAVVALAVGFLMFVLLRYLSGTASPGVRRRIALAWSLGLFGLGALAAAALGAGAVIDRFSDRLSGDVRVGLWRDSLRVLAAHPLGIGRGAFDAIFPIYRTVKMPFPVRFAFVENEPLQLLIDAGWVLFALPFAALGLVGWLIWRHGRRDEIEAALVAGLLAIVAHALVDFGLETMGVSLPFMAVLGTVLGRARNQGTSQSTARPALRWALVSTVFASLLIGAASTARASNDNFDLLLKRATTPEDRLHVLERAQTAHPLDYFYSLAYAKQLPLRGAPGTPSPRLHALNRALQLCPSCEVVHLEVARTLWFAGSRKQAVLEWRTAIDLQPSLFQAVVHELLRDGARASELAAVASGSPDRMVTLVGMLSSPGRAGDALIILDQADARGAPKGDVLFARSQLLLLAGKTAEAEAALDAAREAGLRDARVALLESQILTVSKGADGADQALATLEDAAVRFPTDLALQRARLELVMRFEKWKAAARAIQGLELALYEKQGSASEAHIAKARIEARLGHWTAALDAFRVVLAEDPSNAPLWVEYGRVAATSGRMMTAREAYAQAARLSPASADIQSAIHALDAQRAEALSPDLNRR